MTLGELLNSYCVPVLLFILIEEPNHSASEAFLQKHTQVSSAQLMDSFLHNLMRELVVMLGDSDPKVCYSRGGRRQAGSQTGEHADTQTHRYKQTNRDGLSNTLSSGSKQIGVLMCVCLSLSSFSTLHVETKQTQREQQHRCAMVVSMIWWLRNVSRKEDNDANVGLPTEQSQPHFDTRCRPTKRRGKHDLTSTGINLYVSSSQSIAPSDCLSRVVPELAQFFCSSPFRFESAALVASSAWLWRR
jgi:hypothetical protein